jgi:hypothetical protein
MAFASRPSHFLSYEVSPFKSVSMNLWLTIPEVTRSSLRQISAGSDLYSLAPFWLQ